MILGPHFTGADDLERVHQVAHSGSPAGCRALQGFEWPNLMELALSGGSNSAVFLIYALRSAFDVRYLCGATKMSFGMTLQASGCHGRKPAIRPLRAETCSLPMRTTTYCARSGRSRFEPAKRQRPVAI